jgi:regulatory protein
VRAGFSSLHPAHVRWLKVRALRYLAQREHSRSELRARVLRVTERLAPFADAPPDLEQVHAAVDAVLDELQAQAYLCNERFVESRLRTRQARFGTQRIQAELRTHGVSLSDAQKQDLQRSEFERAWAVWSRKFDEAPTGPQSYAKQARFLQNRGFSSDVIRLVLRVAGAAGH